MVAADGGEAVLLVRITAPVVEDAGRRAPVDVAFVLDRSGSMAGDKLELAKAGVDLAVAHLRDEDRAAAIVYDDEVDIVQPLTGATPRAKASLRLALHGVDPGGSTYLSGGWTAGCRELAEAAAVRAHDGGETRIRRVILLTDGLANVGIVAPGDLSRHAGELRRRGIGTTTIGVGLDFDEGLLSAMAEAGGGHFQYAPDPETLRGFFARELRQMASVAVSGLIVTVTIPGDVDAELLSAFPVEKRGGAIEVAIGDMHADDAIDLVLNLSPGPGAIESTIPMSVTAAWTDVQADLRRDLEVGLEPLRRVTAEEADGIEPDARVAEAAALQRAAAERRAGLELDREGDFAASRARMSAAQQVLAAAPMTARVRADLDETAMLAEAPAMMAFDTHTRKSAQFREELRRRGRRDADD